MKNPKAVILQILFALMMPLSIHAQILIIAGNAEDRASLVDARTFASLASLPVGEGPHEIAVSQDGRFAYVAISGPREKPGNRITVLDIKQRAVKTNFDLGEYTLPHDLRVSNDGALLWVTCAPSQTVLEVETGTGKIKRTWKTGQEGGWMLAVTPDERKLYVANFEGKSLSVIDRVHDAVRTIPMHGGQMALDVSPDGREVWAGDYEGNHVAVITTANDSIVATFPSGGERLLRLKFTPNGKEVLAPHGGSKSVTIFDVRQRALRAKLELASAPKVITISGDGKRAFLTNPTDHQVTVVDIAARKVERTFATSKTPDGIVWVK